MKRYFAGLTRNSFLLAAASFVGGLLWDRVGHTAVFYYGAIFGLGGSLGLIILIPKRDHSSVAQNRIVA